MSPARPLLLAAIVIVLLGAPAGSSAPAAGGGVAADLSGARAVEELQAFAMEHPNRFGELPTMVEARAHLVERLRSYGYDVVIHRYDQAGGGGENIMGILRGAQRPHDWVVLSGHYDTVLPTGLGAGVHGAWDNGAGVAASLEIARVAAQRSWNNTLVVVFFDDEELGTIGSAAWVAAWDKRSWEGGNVRLTANLNMDPPGLNWPCIVEGARLPLTMFQNGQRASGTGHEKLRGFATMAKDDVGVPDEYFQFLVGGINIAGPLRGSSDNVNFWNRGIPELWVGGSTHLFLGKDDPLQVNAFSYPLHTPADTLPMMMAYCPNGLDQGFEVVMRIVYGTMERIDSHGGQYPRP